MSSSSYESNHIVQKIQSLGDLEIATLICLIADQHCIIETEQEHIDDVQEELMLVRSDSCLSSVGVHLT